MILFVMFCLLSMSIPSRCNNECLSESPAKAPKYHLMEKCHRSRLGIAGKANFSSLISCQRLGIEKKALALNFSPPEAWKLKRKEPMEYTCEVLKCAEADGGLSLVNDTGYDYYSIFAKPLPDANSTCVPGTGMFHLVTRPLNASAAAAACRNSSAHLADVASEERTDALAQLLAAGGVEAAFVGLARTNETSLFYSVNGDSLECTTYRAWAPGHPRRPRTQRDCVLLSRSKTWRTTDCRKPYPALCELRPGGPYKRRSIFTSRRNETNTLKITADSTEHQKPLTQAVP